ncbi:MAG: PTS system mannose/fructose/sorbose family transporter subunit IID [Desulfuromonadales bacterium]|nr:PTS system mannose/fructose/sorbose family transporter subunit IID [Desulfuromonadales bacterium]
MRLGWQTRLHVWFRLLFLQASWSYQRMQGLGFLFALLPGLRKIYSEEQMREVSLRHAGYFNTHPYLAPLVVGAVLKLEEERAIHGEDRSIDIDDFKEIVAAPYAAIGDALFWGGLRPLVAGITLFFAVKGIVWAPLIFLLVFNLFPFWFRIVFFEYGYRHGIKSVAYIQEHNLPDWAVRIKEAAVVVLGGLCAFMVFSHLLDHQLPSWPGLLALVPMILLGVGARRGMSTLLLIFITCTIIIVAGIFWIDVALFLKL